MEMEIPPITVVNEKEPGPPKKPGPPKMVSWKEKFADIFNQRLTTATGKKTFEDECRYLADWFNEQQKIPAVGTDNKVITAQHVRELARTRGYNAKKYEEERWKYIDRYLNAARAFLASYDAEIQEPLLEIETKP